MVPGLWVKLGGAFTGLEWDGGEELGDKATVKKEEGAQGGGVPEAWDAH